MGTRVRRRGAHRLKLPAGYALLRADRVRAALRNDAPASLREWILAPELARPADAETIPSGRGGSYRATLADGSRVVVRPYRRGDWLGRIVQRTYVGRAPRPFAELVATETARTRGVAVPEVVAARVDGTWVYTGTFVTREIADVHPLLAGLQRRTPGPSRAELAACAGRAIARMHCAGIAHADLNVDNVLVQEDTATASIIDFDRATIYDGPVPGPVRQQNLARFARSRRKRDANEAVFDAAAQAAFDAGYATAWEAACGR